MGPRPGPGGALTTTHLGGVVARAVVVGVVAGAARQDLVLVLIHQPMRDHQRQLVSFPGLNSAAVPQFPVFIHKFIKIWKAVIFPHCAFVKKVLTDLLDDCITRLADLFHHRL